MNLDKLIIMEMRIEMEMEMGMEIEICRLMIRFDGCRIG